MCKRIVALGGGGGGGEGGEGEGEGEEEEEGEGEGEGGGGGGERERGRGGGLPCDIVAKVCISVFFGPKNETPVDFQIPSQKYLGD